MEAKLLRQGQKKQGARNFAFSKFINDIEACGKELTSWKGQKKWKSTSNE